MEGSNLCLDKRSDRSSLAKIPRKLRLGLK
ncbi:uncharacterized protein G2W53_035927 [Senna tora]|uniref:Uncharacterized protein n=1 Tax=Senna tora TaxID=362788 RepID=A0A834SSL6_9FABA|nr:uncharacterized protein G2W53_035927 [Senna tora]